MRLPPAGSYLPLHGNLRQCHRMCWSKWSATLCTWMMRLLASAHPMHLAIASDFSWSFLIHLAMTPDFSWSFLVHLAMTPDFSWSFLIHLAMASDFSRSSLIHLAMASDFLRSSLIHLAMASDFLRSLLTFKAHTIRCNSLCYCTLRTLGFANKWYLIF